MTRRNNNGRRGRKARKQEQWASKRQQIHEKKRIAELDARPKLAGKLKKIARALCDRSRVGIVVIDSQYIYPLHGPMLCKDGYVSHYSHTDNGVVINTVEPWSEMSTGRLSSLLDFRWMPLLPKTVLDRLSEI